MGLCENSHREWIRGVWMIFLSSNAVGLFEIM